MRRAQLLLLLSAAVALGLLLAGCGSSTSGGAGASAGSGGSSGGTSGPDGRFRLGTRLPPALANRPAPTIKLTDAAGGTLDTASLVGTPYLVTFLYTNCPDVCPLIGEEIHQALQQIGTADTRRLRVVAVSVDPRHDNAAAVKAWLKRHQEPPEFHYLIGSEAQLKPVWKEWFAQPQIEGDPESSHSAVIWLVDRQGRLATNVSAGVAFDPSDLAADLRTLVN